LTGVGEELMNLYLEGCRDPFWDSRSGACILWIYFLPLTPWNEPHGGKYLGNAMWKICIAIIAFRVRAALNYYIHWTCMHTDILKSDTGICSFTRSPFPPVLGWTTGLVCRHILFRAFGKNIGKSRTKLFSIASRNDNFYFASNLGETSRTAIVFWMATGRV